MKITEPAIDLGIVMALLSSFRNKPLPPKLVAFGEVGLSGEVRSVSMAAQRVAEARKLGFEVCVLPAVCVDSVRDAGQKVGLNAAANTGALTGQNTEQMQIIGVKNLQDVMNLLIR